MFEYFLEENNKKWPFFRITSTTAWLVGFYYRCLKIKIKEQNENLNFHVVWNHKIESVGEEWKEFSDFDSGFGLRALGDKHKTILNCVQL